jgi:hypothetical protein
METARKSLSALTSATRSIRSNNSNILQNMENIGLKSKSITSPTSPTQIPIISENTTSGWLQMPNLPEWNKGTFFKIFLIILILSFLG